MKKIVLLLMLVLLTSCEGYQAVVYSYGIRQRPEPRPIPRTIPRRVYHYYTPYTYYPVVTPVYVYPSNHHHHHYHNPRGGRR
jgi:hypothetical protein